MWVHHVAALLGIAMGAGLGVAMGSSPVAVADPIVDEWPYGGTMLPGVADGSSVTNVENYSLGCWPAGPMR